MTAVDAEIITRLDLPTAVYRRAVGDFDTATAGAVRERSHPDRWPRRSGRRDGKN